MRKYLLSLLLVLAVFGGIFALYPKKSAQIHADALVGGDTLFFVHCPDVSQSRELWKKTALHAIGQEPDVREFLKKPKTRLGAMGNNETYLNALQKAAPQELFLAVKSLPSHWVAGALCLGDRSKLESALAQAAHQLQQSRPEGQISRLRHKGVDLELLADPKMTLASAWVGRWIFVSNDLDLLKNTVERALGGVSPAPLRDNSRFKNALSHLPAHSEIIAFAQFPGNCSSGLPADLPTNIPPCFLDFLKRTEAVSAGIKFDGEDIRDAIFVATAPGAKRLETAPISRQTLRRPPGDTLLYFEGQANWPGLFQSMAAFHQAGDQSASFSPQLAELRAELAAHGITASKCADMLGAEFGLVVNWPPEAFQPSLTLSLELRDPPQAQKAVELLAGGQLGNTAWHHTQEGDAEVFDLPNVTTLTPTVALKDKRLAIGLDPNSVLASLAPVSQEGGLAKVPSFAETSRRLSKPTIAFGYVDAKALFERLYGACRPLLMLWGGIHPAARELIDVSKLPSTGSISIHLKPIAFSCCELPDGFLAESIGPITFTQSALGVGIGAGSALAPWAKSRLANGLHPPGTAEEAERAN
jgi:hypothetical protein